MDKFFMQRCIDLAKCGLGTVSPNPLVGAVIVHNGRIIGEGWHKKCGEPHAEVNAVAAVKDKTLLPESTIYVSLEPCAHVGRTPACADMLIREGINNVVVGSVDPFEKVAGKGIEKLKNAGVNVKVGVLKEQCDWLNRRFFTFHTKKRPYVILKWAQTKDGFIDKLRENNEQKPLAISNDYFNMMNHSWRNTEDAVLVGKNTVILDNPQLTNRLWTGKSPQRICIDRRLELAKTYRIFGNQATTIIINEIQDKQENNLHYCKIDFGLDVVKQILDLLYQHQIQSVIVEGGRKTLEEFIKKDCWDEAHIFESNKLLHKGIAAPIFSYACSREEIFAGQVHKLYFKASNFELV